MFATSDRIQCFCVSFLHCMTGLCGSISSEEYSATDMITVISNVLNHSGSYIKPLKAAITISVSSPTFFFSFIVTNVYFCIDLKSHYACYLYSTFYSATMFLGRLVRKA